MKSVFVLIAGQLSWSYIGFVSRQVIDMKTHEKGIILNNPTGLGIYSFKLEKGEVSLSYEI